jgi:outer membrane protein assembly factor BamB
MSGIARAEPDMTRSPALFLLLASLALVAGCAVAPGPMRDAGAANGNVAEGVDRIEGVRFTFRTGGAIRTRPLVHAGSVFFGSADGNVYAIDARSGAERWRHTTGGAVVSSAAASDGSVFIASRDGQLYCFAVADGTVRWRHRFAAELGAQNYWDHVLSSPTLQDGRVYIGGGDGQLVALDAASGALLWRYDVGARIRSTPAVGAGLVVVGTMAGRVVAVDAASGRERWTFATDGAAHTFADKGNDTTSVVAAPTIAGALVTVGARDGHLYALDLATGRLAWRTTHDGSSWILSTAYDGSTLYVGSGSALIVQAADPASGAERWRFKTLGAVFSSITIARDTLLFSDFAGMLYAIDSRTGASRWQYPLGARSFATPTVADGIVYAASDNGVLVALSVARDAAPPPLPAPRRIVYWEGAKSPGAFGWFRNGVDLALLGQLKGAGYEQMSAAALAAFMAEAAAGGSASAPSVVVFADNKIPAGLADTSAGPAPIRKYLAAGGKVALLGPNPVIYQTDADSGELVAIDHATPEKVFGVRYPEANIAAGFYLNRPTAAGRAMGLQANAIGFLAVDPQQQGDRFTALALDEFGKASAWLQGYGGRRGTGLLQLTAPRQDAADLSELQAAIEFGIGW